MNNTADMWILYKNKNKKHKWFLMFGFVCVCFVLFLGYQNKHPVVDNFIVQSEKISGNLEGFKIVQISDLHNANFGRDNDELLTLIKNQNPDMAVITGDLVDSNHTNINRALEFAQKVQEICPTYYVTGNHEYWLDEKDLDILLSGLRAGKITILENECVNIDKDNSSFILVGLDDRNLSDNTLANILQNHKGEFTVVLAHEPQYISNYSGEKVDLVMSGHAHGGQFRLPFIGGVVAPDQGFNPQYTDGVYQINDTTMIVSRGLGNSIIPVRLFNYPEIVCVELK